MDHDLPQLNIGQDLTDVVGNTYTIRMRISNGGMGVVYRASGPAGAVAIKMPKRLRNASDLLMESRWCYRPEATDVNGFVPVVALGTHYFPSDPDVPVPFAVMPFFREGTLAQRLKSGLPSSETALSWIIHLAEALKDLDMCHRDLKPVNIFVDQSNRAVVGDFGLAVPVTKSHRAKAGIKLSKNPVGTPDYMSPEQIAGLDDMDSRSDIFSLGLILYEMVTGRMARPYIEHGRNMNAYFRALRKIGFGPGDMELVQDSKVAKIVQRCTHGPRKLRYKDHNELIESCRAAMAVNAHT